MKPKGITKSPPPRATGELFGRAVALHLEGKAEEALAQIEEAMEAGEEQADVYAAAGYLRYERKQFEPAIAAYRKLVQIDPDNATGWFNLAASMQALEKWKDAAAFLGTSPERNMRLGFSDSRFYRYKSVPSVVYGPVPHNMGGPDEYVALADLDAVFYVHAMTVFDYLASR